MQAKIEKVTFVEGSEWEWPKGSGTFNYNFIVKLEGIEDKRYIHVSKDKNNPKIQSGMSGDFTIDETKTIKVTVGGKNYEYPKIEAPKQAFGGGGGGGRSFTRAPKTYNEYLNELAWQTQQHTINFFCHRITLDPLKEFQKYYDVFYSAAFDKLKKD